MAKILPANLAPDALPRIRGVLITRISRGVIIAQQWPRKRGKMTNANVIFTSTQFSLACQMAANPEPMSLVTAMFLTKGSQIMPRDLLVMAAYGKAYEVTVPGFGIATQAYHGPPLAAHDLWTPADLGPALLAWYRADTLTGNQDDPIVLWPDASGNGNDAQRAGCTVTLDLANLNGLNTLKFPGSSPGWYDVPGIYAGATEGAMFSIMKQFTDPPPSDPQSGFDKFGSNPNVDHVPYIDGNVYSGFCSTARKGYGNPTPSLAAWRIVGWHSAAADHGIFIDGTLFNSTAVNTFGATANPTIGTGLGNGNFYRGSLAENWYMDRKLTINERQRCEGYAAWKFDLTANLPAGHPYKLEPPMQ